MVQDHIFYMLYHYRILPGVVKKIAAIRYCFTLSWLPPGKSCNLRVGITTSFALFVFYCVMDCHKFSDLKRHALILQSLCV